MSIQSKRNRFLKRSRKPMVGWDRAHSKWPILVDRIWEEKEYVPREIGADGAPRRYTRLTQFSRNCIMFDRISARHNSDRSFKIRFENACVTFGQLNNKLASNDPRRKTMQHHFGPDVRVYPGRPFLPDSIHIVDITEHLEKIFVGYIGSRY